MSNPEAMARALTDVVTRGDFTVPPYPAVALRLQRVLARDGYGIGEVADVVAADASLATTVLAAANSAVSAGSSPITTLSRAVNRLGARTVGSIAVANGVGSAAVTAGVLFDVKFRVWRRGITCALAAQKLGASRGLVAEEAFLAGLLHAFGRSIAVASLEKLLKTHAPPRPLSVSEWLGVADLHRAPLARAVAESWQLPPSIAAAVAGDGRGGTDLDAVVTYADKVAADLDASRPPQARDPVDQPLLDQLIAELPSALEAYAPLTPSPPSLPRPAPPNGAIARPHHALEGELRQKSLAVADRRTKGAAQVTCLALSPSGIELDSSRAFQESSMVRLVLGAGEAAFEHWFNVVLCVPIAARYRVELQLFSPTREARERWRAMYDAP
jgi:HD-like signal output (HDOD) protein